MTKTKHFAKRSAERGIDDLSFSILTIFGERLGRRDGIRISKATYDDLKSYAIEIRKADRLNKESHSF